MIRLLLLVGLILPVWGFDAVTLIAPDGEFWCGQPVPVTVELRGKGLFKGAASFRIPEMERTQWMRRGNPTVLSERGPEGEIFVQRHNFWMVTQQDGEVTVPEVSVGFSLEQNGDVTPVEGTAASFIVKVTRPPGVPPGRFVVTTTSHSVTQRWSGSGETVPAGTIVTRTVEQTADSLSGMSLPPVPLAAPAGVRVSPPKVSIDDRENRGALTGGRQEEVRYRLEAPGPVTLPAVTFQTWNPRTETLEAVRLDGLEIRVKGAPRPLTGQGGWLRSLIPWLGVLCAGVGVWRARVAILSHLPRKVSLPPLNTRS